MFFLVFGQISRLPVLIVNRTNSNIYARRRSKARKERGGQCGLRTVGFFIHRYHWSIRGEGKRSELNHQMEDGMVGTSAERCGGWEVKIGSLMRRAVEIAKTATVERKSQVSSESRIMTKQRRHQLTVDSHMNVFCCAYSSYSSVCSVLVDCPSGHDSCLIFHPNGIKCG